MWSWANPQLRAAAVCLAIAVVYAFLWPGRKNPASIRQMPWPQRLVLRWFHSIAWLVVAVACLFWSKLLAALAAVIYITYLWTVRRTSPRTGP